MIHIYYLLLLVAVSLGSSYITTQLPTLKQHYKRILTRLKRKSPKSVPNETPTYITREDYEVLIQQINQAFINYDARVSAMETKLSKRESNQRTFIRSEVRNYLQQLQK